MSLRRSSACGSRGFIFIWSHAFSEKLRAERHKSDSTLITNILKVFARHFHESWTIGYFTSRAVLSTWRLSGALGETEQHTGRAHRTTDRMFANWSQWMIIRFTLMYNKNTQIVFCRLQRLSVRPTRRTPRVSVGAPWQAAFTTVLVFNIYHLQVALDGPRLIDRQQCRLLPLAAAITDARQPLLNDITPYRQFAGANRWL